MSWMDTTFDFHLTEERSCLNGEDQKQIGSLFADRHAEIARPLKYAVWCAEHYLPPTPAQRQRQR